MARLLEHDGFYITARALGAIRRDMGLLKRYDGAAKAAMDERAFALVQEALDLGPTETMGANRMYSYMRTNYGIVGR